MLFKCFALLPWNHVLLRRWQCKINGKIDDIEEAGTQAVCGCCALLAAREQPALQAAPLPSLKPSATKGAGGFEQMAAQELFRVVLFLVFYGQIWAMGLLPYIGKFVYGCDAVFMINIWHTVTSCAEDIVLRG